MAIPRDAVDRFDPPPLAPQATHKFLRAQADLFSFHTSPSSVKNFSVIRGLADAPKGSAHSAKPSDWTDEKFVEFHFRPRLIFYESNGGESRLLSQSIQTWLPFGEAGGQVLGSFP
jgi:hypothetical protein